MEHTIELNNSLPAGVYSTTVQFTDCKNVAGVELSGAKTILPAGSIDQDLSYHIPVGIAQNSGATFPNGNIANVNGGGATIYLNKTTAGTVENWGSSPAWAIWPPIRAPSQAPWNSSKSKKS